MGKDLNFSHHELCEHCVRFFFSQHQIASVSKLYHAESSVDEQSVPSIERLLLFCVCHSDDLCKLLGNGETHTQVQKCLKGYCGRVAALLEEQAWTPFIGHPQHSSFAIHLNSSGVSLPLKSE